MQVRNEKARKFLVNMRRKPGTKFEQVFPKADRGALRLLKQMLSFDPAERPTSEAALADPYFAGLTQPGREPTAQPVSKLAFEFERRKLDANAVSKCSRIHLYLRVLPASHLIHLRSASQAIIPSKRLH